MCLKKLREIQEEYADDSAPVISLLNLIADLACVERSLLFDDIENAAILFKGVGVDHIRYSWMFDKQGTAGLTAKQIEYIGVLIPMIQDKN